MIRFSTFNARVVLSFLCAGMGACASNDSARADSDFTTASTGDGGAEATECQSARLTPIADGVNPSHACASWLEKVRGRVGTKMPIGSFVVWSRRTQDGYAVVTGAMHTLGASRYAPLGQDVHEEVVVPSATGLLDRCVPASSGELGCKDLSPFYELYHPEIPAAEHTQSLVNITPKHDFYVGLVDRQHLAYDDNGFPAPPDRQPGSVPLYDPQSTSTLTPSTSTPTAGDTLLLVGYPAAGPETGAFSVGKVLTDDDVATAFEALRAAGDEEGSLPYDPSVELIVSAKALGGMSGGGVFDRDGRLAGVMVRGSSVEGAPEIVRVVRASMIASRLAAAVAALPEATKAEVTPYLEQP